MSKKMMSLLAIVMALCMLFAGCAEEEPTHTHTFDTSKWVSDETMHWHGSTCGHADERTDIQGHIDENIDGVCDVCGYAGNHTHTYEEKWSYDETNHWHAANCFHNLISDSAAHTPDDMGVCDVCGYKVSDPVVDSVEQAVEVGVAQKETVKFGTIKTSEGADIEFSYRNGYLYVKDGTTEYFYSPLGDDQVFAVVRTSAWDEVYISRDTIASVDNLEGPVIPNAFINNETAFYGAEDLVSNLYERASIDNANGDFAESVANGVYTFSYGYYIEGYGLFVITVNFTLDETTYAIATVELESKHYGLESVEEVTASADGMPATYAPKADAEAAYVYTVSIQQGIDAENPFNPAELLATDFQLVDENGTPYGDTITIESGAYVNLYIGALVPDTANPDFLIINAFGENVNLEGDDSNVANSLTAFPYGNYLEVKSNAVGGTTYALTVSVNGVEKTYTIVTKDPVPTTITGGIVGEEYGNTVLTPGDKLEMEQGENQSIGAYLDKKIGEILVTVSPEVALEEGQYASFSIWLGSVSVRGTSYNLSKMPVGEYVFTFTSSVNPELTTSITVTIKEKAPAVGPEGDFITPAGSGTQADPFVLTQSGTYLADVPSGQDVYYIFTATEAGKVDFKFTSNNGYLSYGTFNFMLCDKATENAMTIDLNAEQKLYMKVGTSDYSAGKVTFTVTLPGAPAAEEDKTESLSGTGIMKDPFVITESGKYTASVFEGSEVFFAYTAKQDVTITFTFNDKNGYLTYGTFSFMLCDKNTQDTMTLELGTGETVFMKVTSYDMGVTGKFSFTFTIEGETNPSTPGSGNGTTSAGTGTQADPFAIKDLGKFVATVEEGSYVFYTFKVEKDGKITLNFEGDNWDYAYGTFNFNLCSMGFNNSVTIDVKAGDTLYLKVGSFNADGTMDISFTISME